ncbi:hypothetical protein RRG08_037116 [Elysia crispata]|uniref:Uncharacterized protein n=1 Tax=Elysia crispata TaxID=231223 RepID=A0AAE0Y554_9GAST|nr:hypothetical protein RRG08_037116 [Elysia crispata]
MRTRTCTDTEKQTSSDRSMLSTDCLIIFCDSRATDSTLSSNRTIFYDLFDESLGICERSKSGWRNNRLPPTSGPAATKVCMDSIKQNHL